MKPRYTVLTVLVFLTFSCCTNEGTPPPAGNVRPYYAGRTAEAAGSTDEAAELYRLELERGGGDLVTREAAWRLLRLLLDEGAFREARRTARILIDRFERDGRALSFYAEACLAQGRNRQALWAAKEAWDSLAGPEELLLLAEASRRVGLDLWRTRMLDLFLHYPASEVHLRARNYLSLPFWEKPEGFLTILVRGKVLAAEGRNEEALDELLKCFGGGCPLSPLLVRETAALFDRADRREEGRDFFLRQLSDPAADYKDEVFGAMHDYVAESFAAEGRHNEAAAYLAALRTGGRPISDASARVLTTALMRVGGPDSVIDTVEDLLPELADPGVLSGLLDEILTYLVREGRWERIARLGKVLEQTGPRSEAARCAYITGRAMEEGYLSRDEAEPVDFFRTAGRLDPRGYYGFVSAPRLPGREVPLSGTASGADRAGTADEFVLGFFAAGLTDLALEETYGRIQDLGPAAAVAAAEAAAGQGYYLEALRIMLRWNAAQNTPPEEDPLRFLYPRWFHREITEAADRHGIPDHIFLGLVREESAFQYDIVSHAGAVGLSQLMPATAEYAAGLMSLDYYDIEDPADNTLIGSWYLARVRSNLPSYGHSLAAYNAGPGRTAGWVRWFGSLPADLFAEAIPINETRRYVKRVLVSSVYYGYLYSGIPPEETVRLYYF